MWHTGREDAESFWLGLSRRMPAGNGITLATLAWGFDADVPWSWVPTFHRHHEAVPRLVYREDGGTENIVAVRCHLSWLGFTVGILHKSKWLTYGAMNNRAPGAFPAEE
jgi:hypothetical protein